MLREFCVYFSQKEEPNESEGLNMHARKGLRGEEGEMGMQSTVGEKLALTRRVEQFFLEIEYSQREGKKLKIFI